MEIREPGLPATAPQVRMIFGVGKAKGLRTALRLGEFISRAVPGKADPTKLTMGEAHNVIEALNALPDPPGQAGLF